jgi:hypothetical protein
VLLVEHIPMDLEPVYRELGVFRSCSTVASRCRPIPFCSLQAIVRLCSMGAVTELVALEAVCCAFFGAIIPLIVPGNLFRGDSWAGLLDRA